MRSLESGSCGATRKWSTCSKTCTRRRGLSPRSSPGPTRSKAEQAFLEVRALRPGDPRAPMYLANVALLRGDEAAAKARIEEALRLAPQFVPPLLDYARWLAGKGRNAEAIEVAKSAVARRPGDAGAVALVRQLEGSGRRSGS